MTRQLTEWQLVAELLLRANPTIHGDLRGFPHRVAWGRSNALNCQCPACGESFSGEPEYGWQTIANVQHFGTITVAHDWCPRCDDPIMVVLTGSGSAWTYAERVRAPF